MDGQGREMARDEGNHAIMGTLESCLGHRILSWLGLWGRNTVEGKKDFQFSCASHIDK